MEAHILVTARTLIPAQSARLAQIALFKTRYEAVIVMADGSEALLGYLRRYSMQGLIGRVGIVGERIVAYTGCSHQAKVTIDKKAKAVILTDGGAAVATISFSGRTERDAIMAGELARIPLPAA